MFSKSKSPFVIALLTVVTASISFAQQPQSPSQRFKPERNVPPSVHVPDGASKRVSGHSSPSGTNYNFSDTPVNSFRSRAMKRTASLRKPVVRPVSYQEEVGKQSTSNSSSLPAGLRSSGKQEFESPKPLGAKSALPPRTENFSDTPRPATDLSAPKNSDGIVVDQSQFAQHEQQLQRRLDELKKLRRLAEGNNQPAATNLTDQIQADVRATQQAPGRSWENSVQHAANHAHATDTVQVTNAHVFETNETGVSHVQRVSAESEAIQRASVDLSTPGIRVQSFGPNAIGINKIATYKVAVTNDGNHDAEQLQIGVGIPGNIDLQNIIVSAGHHEITDGVEKARLIWTVERIPANTTHTIAINVIPRSAEPFDMEVNWTFLPRSASTQIRVTEPQLEMKISGPTEVQFGEKATYDVTVVNPGTGDAEQVSVMLPEALGGERASIGNVPAGSERRFKVELFARTAGQLNLTATAVGDGDIKAVASHDIMVRRANLKVEVTGPPMKYAGSIGQYTVTIRNDGDATASDVAAVLAMPNGVQYLGGIDSVENNDGGLKWNVGTLTSGNSRTFKINCQLDASGHLTFQAGARGAGDLAATNEWQTKVDTIADLTLDVEDPKGPLPTGENVNYKIVVKNRGTRSANGVDLVMQFSEGIEPVKADGFKSKIVTGQVIFAPITRIEPGQQIVLNVTAQALKSGTHIFRAQLTCKESDAREIGEGTTRFFGDEIATDAQQLNLPAKANTADASVDSSDNTNDFK